MPVLVHRLVAPQTRQWLFVVAALLFYALTMVGSIALFQKQPQILVAFLTLIAIERSDSSAPVSAGLALALAAALKLYPAVFVLFWLASGRRREALCFALAGGALGLLSIAVAGWPLHEAFLSNIRSINQTSMLTRLSYSIESVVAVFAFPGKQEFIKGAMVFASDDETGGWYVLREPRLFTQVFNVVQLTAVAALVWLFAKTRGRHLVLWPLAMMFVTLTGPIAWAYYYLAPLAFLPLIFLRLRPLLAWSVYFGAMAAISPLSHALLPRSLDVFDDFYIHTLVAGVVAQRAVAGAFLAILRADLAAKVR